MTIRILAADIGATNSRFALVLADTDDEARPLLAIEREQWLKGADYAAFQDALAALTAPGEDGAPPLLDPAAPPDVAVIAPAGPVQGDSCKISNLPWLIHAEAVRQALRMDRVLLINDFAAQAYACLMPEAVNATLVLPGREKGEEIDGATAAPGADDECPIAVVGAGTGFGKAQLLCPPPVAGEAKQQRLARFGRAVVLPSEGGHADFPFAGEREFAFAAFAAARAGTPRLIGDAIVSGAGLAHIHAFLSGESLPIPEATARAVDRPDVMAWFARFYGRACRNYVLDTLALRGLYVTGGMALRVPVLTHPAFAQEFTLSAAQHNLLSGVPVRHIRKPQAGLLGAALYGLLRL